MTQKQKNIIRNNIIIYCVIALFNIVYIIDIPFIGLLAGLYPLACLVISIFYFGSKNKEYGKAFLLSFGVMLLIGFTVCTGALFLMNS